MFRKFNDNELQIWSTTIAELLTIIPYMRDVVANIIPVYTENPNSIAGIDKYWRCIFGDSFFNDLNLSERCGVIAHEVLHVVNNHFARAIQVHNCITEKDNIAADLEINTTLSKHMILRLTKDALYPDTFDLPNFQSYEYYYDHLPELKSIWDIISDILNEEYTDDSSGINGDLLSTEVSDALTDAGFSEISNAEKVIAMSNTLRRAVEHMKSIGNVAGLKDDILQLVIRSLTPAKADWRHVLSECISRARYAVANHKMDYSYRKINRRAGNKDISPGLLSYKPKVMIGIDVSGSVSNDEHLKMLSEVDEIIRQQAHSVEVFAMDTEVSNIQIIQNVNQIKLFNGGGTALECGFAFVKDLSKTKRPDIFVVFSDGENMWDNSKEHLIQSIKYVVVSTSNTKYLEQIDFAELIIIDDKR